MFYSQFILAKKGPLGTIWIAAHLERKLRKNQVADTDIGVSVDSILSPDVPIALRLSSHLLLGVVRIYSRKVNYLFDDCSEALLKIKQAFRSAAVDLPPEESKAPYHSITLPETFDLDDFELPDNDIFHNNFVDHHISSRDQITLQDTMEGVSYSTSKFGLDERFGDGDGDASGLDLDEELFLNKIETASHVNESVDPQPSSVSLTPLKQDEEPETRTVNSETMVDLDDDTNFMDYAQAPCTPGLVDEPNLSNVQEVSACDDHLEFESHLAESIMTEKTRNTVEDKQEVDWCSGNNKSTDATPTVQTKENGVASVDVDLNLSKQQGEVPIESAVGHVLVDVPSPRSDPTSNLLDKTRNPTAEFFDKMTVASDGTSSEGLHNGSVDKDIHTSPPVDNPSDDHQGPYYVGLENSACEIFGQTSMCKQPSEGLSAIDYGSLQFGAPGSVEAASDREKLSQIAPSLDLEIESNSNFSSQNPDTQAPHLNPLSIDVHENVASAGVELLLPCKSNLQPLDSVCARSTAAEIPADDAVLATSEGEEMQGKACHVTDNTEENLMGNNIKGDLHPAFREPEGEVHNEDYQDKPAETEFLAPEKLLSVPGFVEQHKNMLEESPGEFVGLYESHAASKNISGKKRSFTESTLTEQSLNSVESSRLVHFKRTVESVPDDDDLLSSILVGRSSVLKVKPTPRLFEATSMKRTRLASRTATPKRKVLMDETMVLHGDTIRQQLTNTEDIRRVRKKAPCTLPEISVIQKQHLEDEIFLGSTFTGMSSQLSSLHSQIWDLSRIKVFKNDFNGVSGQIVVEPVLPPADDEKVVSHETMAQPSPTSLDAKNDDSLSAAAEPHITSQSTEICQTVGTKVGNGPGELHVTEQSNMLVDRDNDEARQSVNPQLSDGRMKESDEINIIIEQTETTGHVNADFSFHELLPPETGVERNQKDEDTVSSVSAGVKPAGLTGDQSDDILDSPVDLVQQATVNETNGTDTTADAETPAVLPDQKIDLPSFGFESSVMDIDNEETVCKHFTEKDDGINAAVEPVPVTRDEFLSGVVNDSGDVELFSNAEHEHIASIYQADIGMGDESFMNNGENPEQLEGYPSYMMNADPGFDLHDQEELNYYAAGNDTDFLNVDDDELNDMADDEIPDDEEARFAENTGWSSRTRAVSKYLQTLFIKEAEHGRKSLSMDNLLTGKSRKEASRMFFEALVLKTRDYIHVEQRNTFDDITIKPRARLLKSDF